MKNPLPGLFQPSSLAGLAAALGGINWASIAPLGTAQWWAALVTVTAGVVATFVRGRE